MTLKTWKKEFYPITAKQAARGSVIKALQHSIQKWEGLKKSNLRKYGVETNLSFHRILDDDDCHMNIDAESCALCHKFYMKNDGSCEGCPLYNVRGETRCDQRGSNSNNPFRHWLETGNPSVMLEWLHKALESLEKTDG